MRRPTDPLAAEERTVAGGAGAPVFVRAAGPAAAPAIVLLHGFAQTADCWDGVLRGPLAAGHRLVAVDLRGHGRSAKPEDGYDDPALWAADLRAVLDGFALDRPVVVAWSYGGLALCDFLRVEGDAALGGCAFVAASTRINDPSRDETVGAAMVEAGRALTSRDPEVRAQGEVTFARRLRGGPSTSAEVEAAVAQMATVPVPVRRRLLARHAENDDVLGRLVRPTLVVQGGDDPLILPAMSERTARAVPGAQLVVHAGRGHSVFAEDPARFEAELRALVARARA